MSIPPIDHRRLSSTQPTTGGQQLVAAEGTVKNLPFGIDSFRSLPKTTRNEDGKPGDPINMVLLGSKEQLVRSFEQAGWTPAAKKTIWTSLKMVFCTLFHREYLNAPVSHLYLGNENHAEDLAFERSGKTTSKRDHIRLWDTGRKDANGQEIWVAAATRDVGIEMNHRDWPFPTHKISPDVDAERDEVAASLRMVGADQMATLQRGASTGHNGEGDYYYTSGNVDVISASGQE